jgi:hypothetical protein
MSAARFDGWIPVRVFWRDAKAWIDWCWLGERRLKEPFFRDTVGALLQEPFNKAFRRETPIEALMDWHHAKPGLEPTAFVFHASRCGSTLISQMLAALDSHIVVSEPPMLDAILRAHYTAAWVDENTRIQWLRGLLSALAQPRNGETRFVVKLDAWSVFELAIMRKAFPRTPWIYLYRDPLEIAVSQMKERAFYMVPGVLGPALYMFAPGELADLPPEEFISRLLGKMLEAGHAGCAAEGGLPLHYNELPQAVWTSHREVLGIGADSQSLQAMQAAARWDAKNPQMEFVADSQRKQGAARPELRRLVERWAAPSYLAIEADRADRHTPPGAGHG